MPRSVRKAEKQSLGFAKKLRRSMTDAEVILWSNLRRRQLGGYKFHRQKPIGPYIADFACVEKMIIIELDGGTHSTDAEVRHDRVRTEYLSSNGWTVIRYTNDDVYKDLDNTMNDLLAHLTGAKDD